MGRNNEDFESAPPVYHASWRQNRQSIEEHGLRAMQPWDDMPKGVYVGKGPHKGYGNDIYEIKMKSHDELVEDPMEYGAHVIPRDVPVSDLKRVGHVFEDQKTGHSEVHWHPEEECNGAQ